MGAWLAGVPACPPAASTPWALAAACAPLAAALASAPALLELSPAPELALTLTGACELSGIAALWLAELWLAELLEALADEAGGGTDADDGEVVGMAGGELLVSCFFGSSQLLTSTASKSPSAKRHPRE